MRLCIRLTKFVAAGDSALVKMEPLITSRGDLLGALSCIKQASREHNGSND